MFQRLFDTSKWIWCALVLLSGPIWSPVSSVNVRSPPRVPSTIEAQAKFFQDFFSVQLSPYKIEFGHVCEDPNTWEQRYEKKDFKNHRDMGKVRWGDKKGGYGEHYWDLNHAGQAGKQDDYDDSDDGSYHEPNEIYNGSDEHGEQIQNNDSNEYNPQNTRHYEENTRNKRGELKKTISRSDDIQNKELEENYKHKKQRKAPQKRDYRSKMADFEDEVTRHFEERHDKVPRKRDKNHEQEGKQSEPKRFLPYESGAGVRQHVRPEIADTSIPRLYIEPSTGHVIDRTTGHAYALQPIPHVNYS